MLRKSMLIEIGEARAIAKNAAGGSKQKPRDSDRQHVAAPSDSCD